MHIQNILIVTRDWLHSTDLIAMVQLAIHESTLWTHGWNHSKTRYLTQWQFQDVSQVPQKLDLNVSWTSHHSS